MSTSTATGTVATGSNLYSTLTLFKQWVADNVAHLASRDTEMTNALYAASRKIDQDCGRVFYRTNGATRSFYVNIRGRIDLIDLIAETTPTLTIDWNWDDVAETVLTASDYVLLPKVERDGTTAVRYQYVRSNITSTYQFVEDHLVTINGDWGYVDSGNAAPDAIEQACLLSATRLYFRRYAPTQTDLVVPEMGRIEIDEVDQDYKRLIAPYIHPHRAFWVA